MGKWPDEARGFLRRRRARREPLAWRRSLEGEPVTRPFSHGLPQELVGHIFLVGNVLLGIPRHMSLRHPCCVLQDRGRMVKVSKGTDLRNVLPHMRELYVVVYPDGSNGLTKATAFEPFSRDLPIKAIFVEDHVGVLSEQDLRRVLEAVARNGA